MVVPDIFVPDPSAFPDRIVIRAPGEGNALITTGVWNIATGQMTIDLAPLHIEVSGGVDLDPFDLTTETLGALFCDLQIPAMSGFRPPGSLSNPGPVTLVGRDCVTGPGLNDTFLLIIKGTLTQVFVPGTCGDGVLNAGEQCDDANTAGGDGCSASCQLEVCGNGVVDVGELCDDGNTVGGDGWSAACQTEICGNAVLDPGEQCDDGNTAGGDGCSAICQYEVCGNAVVDPAEQCDDGNLASGDGCSAICQIEICGNGVLDPPEECDDGNTIPADGCSATTTRTRSRHGPTFDDCVSCATPIGIEGCCPGRRASRWE